MFVTVVQTHTCGSFAGRLPGSCSSVRVGDGAWRVFQPEGTGAQGRREGSGRPPDGKGLCFPHSLLLEHLLRSWERIPKKVRSWGDMAGCSGFVPSATGPTFWEGTPLALLVWNTKQNGSSGFPPGLNLNVLSLDFSYSADTEVIARNHSVLQAYQPGSAEEGQR